LGLSTANLIVAEAREVRQGAPPTAGCKTQDSVGGGTLATPSTGAKVLPTGVPNPLIGQAATVDGSSSFAAPQIAGLAAYVWALRPELSAAQVVSILEDTAVSDPACGSDPPIVDAYAAVLGVDRPSDLRVRRAILDIDGDGDFDTLDALVFLDNFAMNFGLNYSRYDLNGDGYTQRPSGAGAPRRLFDANASGNAVPMTDQEILCYFVTTSLFESHPDVPTPIAERCLINQAPLGFAYLVYELARITRTPPLDSGKVYRPGGVRPEFARFCQLNQFAGGDGTWLGKQVRWNQLWLVSGMPRPPGLGTHFLGYADPECDSTDFQPWIFDGTITISPDGTFAARTTDEQYCGFNDDGTPELPPTIKEPHTRIDVTLLASLDTGAGSATVSGFRRSDAGDTIFADLGDWTRSDVEEYAYGEPCVFMCDPFEPFNCYQQCAGYVEYPSLGVEFLFATDDISQCF
jgi:hypothetical protein